MPAPVVVIAIAFVTVPAAIMIPAAIMVPPTAVVIPFAALVFESFMVEPAAIEVVPVVSFEIGAIVFEVEAVAIVAVPGGVVIVGVAGEFGLADGRSCIVSTLVHRGGFINGGRFINGSRFVNRGRCDIYPGARDTEADVRVYKNLGITFGSDEAGGYNGRKDE